MASMKSWNAANGVPRPQRPSLVMYAMFRGSDAPESNTVVVVVVAVVIVEVLKLIKYTLSLENHIKTKNHKYKNSRKTKNIK